MSLRLSGLLLLFVYLALIPTFTAYLQNRPFTEKIGYTLQPEILRLIAADQKQAVASSLILKAIIYYGGLVEKNKNKLIVPPDYFGIYKTVETAVKLDPYNMDGYYFAQAILAWDVNRIREANLLLEYGMRYRTWDYYLPFFVGFNYAYFLKDYARAADCYKLAGELSGAELYQSLAGRYLQEAGKTDLAIGYLTSMEKGAKNDAIRKTFLIRLNAFKEVKRIESSRDTYRQQTGRLPGSVEELVTQGYLVPPPSDPYGGRFYLDKSGMVRATSKFTLRGREQEIKSIHQ